MLLVGPVRKRCEAAASREEPSPPARRHRLAPRAYGVYGLCLKSPWSLPFPELARAGMDVIELAEGPASLFSPLSRNIPRRQEGTDWFHHLRLPDRSDYLRWTGLFEFLISAEGRQITCHALNGASREAFQTYLLGQVLSFALIKQGIEPLHATVAVVNGRAAAFLGDCGYGKSSLGAAFLQAGHSLLTDDLLVLKKERHRLMAQPGVPRIKLFPEIAHALLGGQVAGTPMNPGTPKLVIPLPPHLFAQNAQPLGAIYVLNPPGKQPASKRVTIKTLPHRRAWVELTANTFNPVVAERDRLARQFHWAAWLASQVPVKSLSYPRDLASLPEVREAVESDLTG